MVSHLSASDWHDLHLYQSSAIPLHTSLHHLQESDHHPHRLRRGSLVRRQRNKHAASEFWLDGVELGDRGMGGHPARFAVARWERGCGERGGGGEDQYAERRVRVDDDELFLLGNVSAVYAETDQVDQLQRL